MADSKLSALSATSALNGSDIFYVDQGGTSKQVSLTNTFGSFSAAALSNGTTGSGNIVLASAIGQWGFAGTGVAWDSTNRAATVTSIADPAASTLTLTGGTALTTSQPVLNMTQTWNNAATVFTGLKFTLTNTNSAANSLFASFVSGSNSIKLSPIGSLIINTQASGTDAIQLNYPSGPQFAFHISNVGISFGTANSFPFFMYVNNGSYVAGLDTNADFEIASPQFLGFTSDTSLTATSYQNVDVCLGRKSTSILSIYDYWTDNACSVYVFKTTGGGSRTPTNYEAGIFDWRNTSNVLSIGTVTGGSGSARALQFLTGGTLAFKLDTNQTLFPLVSLSTGMTTGFINIPGAAGAPSGTPATTTGFPMYYDSTNNQFYVYNGAWKKVTLT